MNKYFSTGNEGFNNLFYSKNGITLRDANQPNNTGGIFGVIFGTAGSGKSILSLQMCCAFVWSQTGAPQQDSSGQTNSRSVDDDNSDVQNRYVIYISRESTEQIKKKIENDFQFFCTCKEKPAHEDEHYDEHKHYKDKFCFVDAQGECSFYKKCSKKCDNTKECDKYHNVSFDDVFMSNVNKDNCDFAKNARIFIFELPHCDEKTNAIHEQTIQARVIKNVIYTAIRTLERNRSNKADSKNELLIMMDSANIISSAAWERILEAISNLPQHHTVHNKTEDDYQYCWKLHNICATKGIHVFFSFETTSDGQSIGSGCSHDAIDVSASVQAYAADVVFQLGQTTHSDGYKSRYVEIVKVKNQAAHLGRHPANIIGNDTKKKKCVVSCNNNETPSIGFVVYPSLAVQHHLNKGSINESKRDSQKEESTDTDSQSTESSSKKHPDTYNLRNIGKLDDFKFDQGSSNAIISNFNPISLELALNFPYARSSNNDGKRKSENVPMRTLLVSFQHLEKQIQELRSDDLFPPKDEKHKLIVKYYPPSPIFDTAILDDVQQIIQSEKKKNMPIEMVIFSNIQTLNYRYPLVRNVKHFLSVVHEYLHHEGITSLFVEVLSPESNNTLIYQSDIAALVDNVFLLRTLTINAKIHNIFSQHMSLGGNHNTLCWGLQQKKIEKIGAPTNKTKTGICAYDFSNYKLDTINPELVKIYFSFHYDVATDCKAIMSACKGAIKPNYRGLVSFKVYQQEDYSLFQKMSVSLFEEQPACCHVISIDEIWLEWLLKQKKLKDMQQYFSLIKGTNQNEINADNNAQDNSDTVNDQVAEHTPSEFITSAGDVAHLMVIEDNRKKSSLNNPLADTLEFGKDIDLLEASPFVHNLGVLIYSPQEICHEFKYNTNENEREPAKNYLQWDNNETAKVLYEFLNSNKDYPQDKLTWQMLVDVKVKWDTNGKKTRFFTICMNHSEAVVCTLLEIALACEGGKGIVDKLNPDNPDFHACFSEALKILFSLLDKEDLDLLSKQEFRLVDDEPHVLFKRNWSSNLKNTKYHKPPKNNKKIKIDCNGTNCEIKIVDDGNCQRKQGTDSWAHTLRSMPLPGSKSDPNEPTPVSGVWYLGVLEGSEVVSFAARIIQHMISPEYEQKKIVNGHSLPVLAKFYSDDSYSFPYQQRLWKIAKLREKFIKLYRKHNKLTSEANDKADSDLIAAGTAYQKILLEDYPFHRTRIKNYLDFSPTIWQMIVRTAQLYLSHWQANNGRPNEGKLKEYIEYSTKKASEEQKLMNDKK